MARWSSGTARPPAPRQSLTHAVDIVDIRSKPKGGWDGIVNCEVLELLPERKLVLAWTSNVIDTRVTFLL